MDASTMRPAPTAQMKMLQFSPIRAPDAHSASARRGSRSTWRSSSPRRSSATQSAAKPSDHSTRCATISSGGRPPNSFQ